jgi:transposase
MPRLRALLPASTWTRSIAAASATAERYLQRGLQRQFGQWHSARCPRVLGIDEHFFTRRSGYTTTLCGLRNHKVYDVVLGRSELSLEAYFQRPEGKAEVRVVCMDLAANYRAVVRLHFPNARIVADRFHVIRIINHHFLACWRDIATTSEPTSSFAWPPIWPCNRRWKQSIASNSASHRRRCEHLAPRFLRAVYRSRQAGLAPQVQLGQTHASWSQEIAAMWRFTATTASPKASTTKWNSSTAKPTASATSKITGCGLKYYVLRSARNTSPPFLA